MRKFVKAVGQFFKDIYQMFCGKDGKLSIRRVLGFIAFSTLIYICIYVTRAEKTVMESVIWALVAIIAGFFTLTTVDRGSGNLLDKFKDIGKDKDQNEI